LDTAKELLAGIFLCKTRRETLPTCSSKGLHSIHQGPIRVHCTGFVPLLLFLSQATTLTLGTLRAHYWITIHAQESGNRRTLRGPTIEQQILPQGKDVVRHLEIPKQGCTLEWILDAMEQMDREAPSRTITGTGKLSGAVYRAYCRITPSSCLTSSADGGDDMEKVLVLAFQRYLCFPIHCIRMSPRSQEDGSRNCSYVPANVQQPHGAGATTSADRIHSHVS